MQKANAGWSFAGEEFLVPGSWFLVPGWEDKAQDVDLLISFRSKFFWFDQVGSGMIELDLGVLSSIAGDRLRAEGKTW